jgi:sodium/proline symporter
MKVLILIPFLLYLAILFIVGFFLKRNETEDAQGFFTGHKRINRFVTAISTAVSARGSWLLLGVTTQAYIIGLSTIWLVAGFIISEFLLFLFLAPAIRAYSEKHNCITINDLFLSRFKGENNSLRIVISAVLVFFSLSFISAQFIGGGVAFYALTGISNWYGVIITGVLMLIIILSWGYKSQNYMDVFQALIILTILIVVPLIVSIRSEGPRNIEIEILKTFSGFFDLGNISIGAILGFLSVGLGSVGNTGLIVKYMSIEDSGQFPRIALLNTAISILLAAGAVITGIIGRFAFPTPDSIPGSDANNIFFGLAGISLSPLLLGLVLCAVFAAGLSAVGSHIFTSASTIASEFLNRSQTKNISQTKLNFLSRLSIVVLVYIAIFAGILIDSGFYSLMLFAWAGLGASFGPAIILSFTWKGTTAAGILAGVITGASTVIIWKSIALISGPVYELIPGFILASLAVWIGSSIDRFILTKKYNRTARFEEINKSVYQE